MAYEGVMTRGAVQAGYLVAGNGGDQSAGGALSAVSLFVCGATPGSA
jgi:hypothetical protein